MRFLTLCIAAAGAIDRVPASAQVHTVEAAMPPGRTSARPVPPPPGPSFAGPLWVNWRVPVLPPPARGGALAIGIVVPVPAGAVTGRWGRLPTGEHVWCAAVQSSGAAALRVELQRGPNHRLLGEIVLRDLPLWRGARGPYRAAQVPETEGWWSPTIGGDSIWIEWRCRDREGDGAPLLVSALAHNHMWPGAPAVGPTGEPLPCHLDARCYGDWAKLVSGVVFLCWIRNGICGVCSGAILNREGQDFCPVIMTARHCEVDARTLECVWGFESTRCNGPAPPWWTLPSSHGVARLAEHAGTDWRLVGLESKTPDGTWFQGWTTARWGADAAIGVHHPRGSHKRISFGRRIGDATCGVTDLRYGHRVDWAAGLTEPGSSGSPVFDEGGYVRGVLSCGPDPACSTRQVDSYGRLTEAWGALSPFLSGASAVWVDWSWAGPERGTMVEPFQGLQPAIFAVLRGGRVQVRGGRYTVVGLTIDRRMTLRSYMGRATFGR
jgi:hypothetical protein